MGTLQIFRDAVQDAAGTILVDRSPVRLLLGAVDFDRGEPVGKYVAPLDLALLALVGGLETQVPENLRSRLLGSQVFTGMSR